MLRKTEPLGFLSGMLLPFFKCKESLEYVGVVANYTQGKVFYWTIDPRELQMCMAFGLILIIPICMTYRYSI